MAEKQEESLLSQVEAFTENENKVPPGYQRIVMSTGGLYGAPKILHCRNFTVQEALDLGAIAQDEIPVKVTKLLQNLIYEEDVKVDDFYESEMAEFCIKFYLSFYGTKVPEQTYTPTEKDKKWMLDNIYQGKDCAEYQNWLRGVENGRIPFTFELDLRQVQYYQLPEKPHTKIRFKNPRSGLNCVFSYPRFGDAALLQKAVDEKFRIKDKQFGPLYEIFKRKQDAEERLRKGENVAIDQIPYLDKEDEKAIKAYELEKSSYIIELMKGLYLRELDGVDVSDKSLSERVELAKDHRIDFSSYQTVAENFSKLEIGPIPKIRIVNPVTGILEEIDHPFRTLELLAYIKNYKSDDSVIEFE